jgi:tRNA-specific 2-thiouridylase
MERVMVAMSGGVDSSVAALLLKRQGHHVVGVTMCLGLTGAGVAMKCCSPESIHDARAVCDSLDIPHYVMDFGKVFRRSVIEPFIAEYGAGRTPNPCVRCNQIIKFDLLLARARAMEFDALATGHYARIVREGGKISLCTPRDVAKDQTYFLYGIKRDKLAFLRFPLEDLTKNEVRALARDEKLPVADKKESQDLCFVNDDGYRGLLASITAAQPGTIVDTEGKRLGTHGGIANFTIGQRKGLGIALGKPRYVVAIDPAARTVVVGDESHLMARGLAIRDFNLLVDALTERAAVKVRYAQKPTLCAVQRESGAISVLFDQPQRAVTCGQSAVLYDGPVVLGGGIIDRPIS